MKIALRRLWFACVLGTALLGAARADVVGLLNGDRSTSQAEVVDSIQVELLKTGAVSAMPTVYVSDGDAMESLLTRTPKAIVTLGAAGLRTALATDMRTPVIATLIPRATFERVMREPGRKYSGTVHAVFLDQPFSRQLDLIHLMNPSAKTVGVLWGPDSQVLRPQLLAAVATRAMAEHAGTVAGGKVAVGEVANHVLEDADVLLAVADPAVFNSATVSNILLASYRAKVPVLGFSPAYVKAGALLGLYSTPAQIGAATADVVRTLLRGGTAPATQYPGEFTVGVNPHVARSMGLELDATQLGERLRKLERKP